MTVQAPFPVIQRPWKGYQDPGLPVGMWIAQGTVLGDASGTNQIVAFVFKAEGGPLGARFYNLEQLEVHHTVNADIDATIEIENFDVVSQVGLVNRQIHLQLERGAANGCTMITGRVRLPIFLGRPQLVGLKSQLEVITANDDGETLFATGQGYIWEPRSLLEDGGLRRPIDSLYGI